MKFNIESNIIVDTDISYATIMKLFKSYNLIYKDKSIFDHLDIIKNTLDFIEKI